MRYFQCSKEKELKEVSDTPELSEIVCHDRRMRELTKDQHDHEVLQRDYVENGGSGPKDTNEMQRLNL